MPTISIDISVSVSTDIQCQSNQGKVTYVPGTE